MYLRQSEKTIYKVKDNESVFHNKKALTILSIGTVTILESMAVLPALAEIKNTFPHLSSSDIQFVMTVPALFVM